MPGQSTNAYISQAIKDARGSQYRVLGVFEHIQLSFQCLEVYTEVRPTTEMMDTTIQILAEVLSILGIVTKEIKEGKMSK